LFPNMAGVDKSLRSVYDTISSRSPSDTVLTPLGL
jgi:hypothetical protein